MFEQRYKRELEAEVDSEECRRAFERLRQEHPIFDRYPTVEALRSLLSPNNKNYTDKDEVMAILLRELRRGNAIYPLVNLVFWDSLYRLYRQRRSRVDDYEELFSRIQWDFYQTFMSHDLERLPRKIDVNIFLNTKKKIIAWEKENIRHEEASRDVENHSRMGLSLADVEKTPVHPEEMEAYLLNMVYRDVVTETQYDLIIETLVYKRMNQREWAEKRGLNYHTARNLRTRAEKAIRQFEKERRKKD